MKLDLYFISFTFLYYFFYPIITICPGSSYPFYIETYYNKIGNYFLDKQYYTSYIQKDQTSLVEYYIGVRFVVYLDTWYLTAPN